MDPLALRETLARLTADSVHELVGPVIRSGAFWSLSSAEPQALVDACERAVWEGLDDAERSWLEAADDTREMVAAGSPG